jgi:hypothetical protein
MTHKERVLHLLSDRRPHSHHELYQLGCVAHSRVSDLRKDGHTIRQWRDGNLYLYQLEGALETGSAASSANPPVDTGTSAAEPVSSASSIWDPIVSPSPGGDALSLFDREAA